MEKNNLENLQQVFNQGLQKMAQERNGQFNIGFGEISSLIIYYQELKKWNRKMNLVSKSASNQEIIEKHFLDSLTLLPYLQGEGKQLLDIGSGAGFPGLVCKLALPSLSVHLVEPRSKRVSFLRHIARTSRLPAQSCGDKKNGICRIHKLRFIAGAPFPEPLAGEKFSHITARAVSDITSLLQLVAGFADSGTTLLLMKGTNWQNELAEAEVILTQQNCRLNGVQEITLPYSGILRYIVELKFL